MAALFERPTLRERMWLLKVLRDDTVGGAVMVVAALIALILANSPAAANYEALAQTRLGFGHLTLDLRTWASDGLLALFFFIAGLELKHELVHGSLSRPAKAVVPVVAAVCGMLVPAAVYLAVLQGTASASQGWAIPMATDIAFALAVLAVLGRGLPLALRAFLLTLAVVDDLGAILVIVLFFSKGFDLAYFLAFLGTCAVWFAMSRRGAHWSLFTIVFATGWYVLHESGVHATVAGVAFGLLTRSHSRLGESESPLERYSHALRPFVAGVAVPVFALMAAGVNVREQGLADTLSSPIAVAVIAGLVIGKPLGILGGSWLVARFTRASLDPSLRWADIAGVGVLAGIGFTVSLLISELAFSGTDLADAKAGILAGSLASALLAAVVLYLRRRSYAAIVDIDERDADGNNIPDIYEQG